MNRSETSAGGPKVLIVEDDATLQRGLRDNFQKHGYDVQCVEDGASGVSAARLDKPDLIVLDIMLPKMNGYAVCEEIRMTNAECTIIMLTAKGQEEDIIRGLECGADDYVTKPFSIRELLARAHAFLRRRSAGPQDSYEFGECHLDLRAHKVYRNGKELTLTSKEYHLLAYLVPRAGRALTRQDILNAVWGSQVIVTTRSVDRCVTTLRAKIEVAPKRPRHIKTIRDVGYRFEVDA